MHITTSLGKLINVFPLMKINRRFNGYFMDREGNIYSNRSRNLTTKLTGSQSKTWSPRYFTLDGASFSHEYLQREAKQHSEFIAETNPTSDQIMKSLKVPALAVFPGVSQDRSHATSLAAGITAKGTIIGTLVDGKLSISSTPVVHTTTASLNAEMERLARTNPGVTYVALQINATAVAGGVNWS